MRWASCIVLGLALAIPSVSFASGWCHGCFGRCWGGCSGCSGRCAGCWGGCAGGGCYGGAGYGMQSGHGWWGAGYAQGNNYYSTCAGVYSGFYASGNGPYSYPFNYYLPSKGYYYYGPPSAAYIYPSGYAPPYTPGYTSIGFTGIVPGTAGAPIFSARPSYFPADTSATRTTRTSSSFDPSAAPESSSNSVRVEVTLPDADAQLLIQGYQVRSTGRTRSFISPPLEPGQAYGYEVTMRRTVNGQTLQESRLIDVRAGGNINVDFTKPEGEKMPVPVGRPAAAYVP